MHFPVLAGSLLPAVVVPWWAILAEKGGCPGSLVSCRPVGLPFVLLLSPVWGRNNKEGVVGICYFFLS